MLKKTFAAEINAEIDHIQKQIVLLRPTPRIVAGNAALKKEREKRNAPVAALDEAVHAFREGRIDQGKVYELSRAKEAHDAVVAQRRAELNAARLDFQPDFEAALLPGALSVISLGNELINLLEQTLSLASDVQQQCCGMGMEAPSPIVRANAARIALYAVRAKLNIG